MRSSCALILLLIEALAFGQGFNRQYDAFGLGNPQGGWNIEHTPTGYAIISGSVDEDTLPTGEWFVHGSILTTLIDPEGEVLSEKRAYRAAHTSVAGWANCCDTIPGGGFVIGGASEAFDGSDEIHLLRLDADGDTLWTRVFGDPTLNDYWIGRQVKRTSESGFVVVGSTSATGAVDGFALKTDSAGNEQWRQTYGWSTSASDALLSVDLAANGDLFMGGSRFYPNGDGDNWVQRVTSGGDLIWRVSLGEGWDEGGTQIATLEDGNVLLASGRGYAENGTAMRPYLAKLDSSDGAVIWEREYGPVTYSTLFFAGKECADGDLIACGVSYYGGGQQGLLLRATSEGDSLWMRRYFYQDTLISNGQGRFYDVLPTNDGGFIATGHGYNPVGAPFPPGYSQDTWVVKVDGDGCIIPGCDGVGITEQATNLLDAITLYPNPASGQVTVQLELPAHFAGVPLQVTLVAADGRLVHQETIASGMGSFTLSLASVRAGMYSVHVSNGTTWLTGAKLLCSP